MADIVILRLLYLSFVQILLSSCVSIYLR